MTDKTQTKKPRAKKATETFEAYKGFDANLACRGYQYEVGKTFKHDGPVRQCNSGFHVCQNPLDVLDFYPLIGDNGSLNRFAKVTVGGKVDRSDDKKWAAAELTVNVELTLPTLIADAIKFVKPLATSGDNVQAASGDYSKLAASGDYSQLAAPGYHSVVAASGYNSTATAGKDGAICLAYWDGKRPRFAIGYVGEGGIEAGVAYTADTATGKLVQA